jgi:Flp pilus assembly protein TadD
MRGLLLLALILPQPCAAVETAEGQTTYWDMLMQAQAARELMQGSQHMDERRYEDAVREFSKAVVRSPNDALAHRMLGVAYYWTGSVDLAEAEFDESLKLEPESAQTHLLLGIVYAWRGKPLKAYSAFKAAERFEPRRADIQMNLGSIEDGEGRYTDALDHFRKAVAYDPSHPLYRFQLGSLYRKMGRDDEAVDSLKAAIVRYPSYQEALLELGSIYERMGRQKESSDMFRKAVSLKARDSVARYRLARALLLDKRPAKAREALAGVFRLAPEQGGGLSLSVAYGGRPEAGKERADKDSEEAPKDASTPQADASAGPLDVLERNLLRLPLDQDASLGVDMVFLPKPKLVKAPGKAESSSSLKQALERAGSPPSQTVASRREFNLKAASSAEREAEVRAIVADLHEALAKAPKDAEVRLGMNLSMSDKPSEKTGDSGEKGRVSYNPHDVGNDLGLWVIGTGWMLLVEETLPKPEDPQPSSSLAWLLQGIGYAALGNSPDAERSFKRSIELDPREALAHLGLGVSKVIRGDEVGAAEAYRKALDLDPKNRDAADGLRWLERPLTNAKDPAPPGARQP